MVGTSLHSIVYHLRIGMTARPFRLFDFTPMGPSPTLLAVAIRAGCEFLTPNGHQCNTLVLSPRGYR